MIWDNTKRTMWAIHGIVGGTTYLVGDNVRASNGQAFYQPILLFDRHTSADQYRPGDAVKVEVTVREVG